jgi:hypothetical protein
MMESLLRPTSQPSAALNKRRAMSGIEGPTGSRVLRFLRPDCDPVILPVFVDASEGSG